MAAGGAEARIDLAGAVRQAALAGLIALALLLPLVGFKTVQNIHNELVLETRWPLLAALVVLIAVGRFAYALLAPFVAAHAAERAAQPQLAATSGWRVVRRWFIPFALGFVIVYPVIALALAGFQGAVKWIDNFGVQILIYVMLGWGLNIVVGLAGLLDLGYVAFYVIGS